MTRTVTRRATSAQTRATLVDRMRRATCGVFDAFTVYLGDQPGFYETLESRGPLTAAELARETRTDERFCPRVAGTADGDGHRGGGVRR